MKRPHIHVSVGDVGNLQRRIELFLSLPLQSIDWR